MRRSRLVLAAIVATGATCAAGVASAQPVGQMSPLEIVTGCAPPITADIGSLRIIGAQDSSPRTLFDNHDLLVVGGGTAAGVQIGQQFYVRRAKPLGASTMGRGAKTLGWIRIVAVNESTAIATVEQVCNGILVNDYLEPFAAPEVPAGAGVTDATGQPDFTALGRVVAGTEDRATLGKGDLALIDWGTEHGLTPGMRFAIYRDVGTTGLPMVNVGEGIVLSARREVALTRITGSRDAVLAGDYVAVRK